MKYKEKCACCGGENVAYTHNINKQMAVAFLKLYARYTETKKPVNITQDLGLTHNQMCNLPKLQYFDLIQKIGNGMWIVTHFGQGFVQGAVKVLVPVATMNNEVLESTHPAWSTHPVPRKWKSIDDFNIEIAYKHKEEYQEEKSDQTKIGW